MTLRRKILSLVLAFCLTLLILVLVIGSIVSFSGCSSVKPDGKTLKPTNAQLIYSDGNFQVVKFHDDEGNATVYVMDGYQSGGMYVLPDEK
jgi:flagellar basal body-associated protein FliL